MHAREALGFGSVQETRGLWLVPLVLVASLIQGCNNATGGSAQLTEPITDLNKAETAHPDRDLPHSLNVLYDEPGLTRTDDPLVTAFLQQSIQCPAVGDSGKSVALRMSLHEFLLAELAEINTFAHAQWRVYGREVNGMMAVLAEYHLDFKGGTLVPRLYVYAPQLNGATFQLVTTLQQSDNGSWVPALLTPGPARDPLNEMAEGWAGACWLRFKSYKAHSARASSSLQHDE